MAGASGNTIGSVNVKVEPDVKGFGERTKAAIEKELAGVSGDVDINAKATGVEKAVAQLDAAARNRTATIDVQVDNERWTRGVLAGINKLMSDADARLKPTVDDEAVRRQLKVIEKDFKELVGAFDPSLDLDLVAGDRADIEAELEGIRQDVENILGRPLDLKPQDWLRNVRQEVQAELKRMQGVTSEQVLNKNAVADLELNLSKFYYQLRVAEAAAEAALRRIDIEINPKLNMSRLAFIRNKIKTDLGKKIDFDFDRNGLTRGLASFGREVSKVASATNGVLKGTVGLLGSIPDVIGGVVGGFARLGPLIVTIAGLIALVLPPILALGAGLVTLLPAFAALAVPIGVVALGLDGIKKAAETARPAFDKLKESVSSVFETGMQPGFEAIRDKLIPMMTEPLQGVASALSNSFNEVIETLSTGSGAQNLKSIIDNVAEGLREATPGMKGFTDGFLELIEGISQKFPGLGQWFTDLGLKFAEQMRSFTEPGEDGFSRLDNLIKGVRNGIEGLTGVFQAFWNQGLKDIQNPDFGRGMTNFFDGVKRFVTDTLPALSEGFKEIAGLIKQLAPLFDGLSLFANGVKMLTNPGEAVADALKRSDAVKEAGGSLGDQFRAAFLDTGTPNAADVQQIGGEVASALQTGIQSGLDAGGALGAGLDGFIPDSLGPQLSSQANDALARVAEEAPQKLGTVFSNVAESVQASWQTIQTAVATGAQNSVDAMQTKFTEIPLLFANVGIALQNAVTTAFAGATLAVGTQSSTLVNTVTEAFSGVPQKIGQSLTGVPEAMRTALQGTGIAVQNAMNSAAQAATAGGAQVAQAAGASFAAVPAAISGALQPCITTVASVCQQMVQTALSFAGAMESSGRSIGASFAKGLASSTDLVAGAANSLMAAARAFFPNSPADEGPFSGSGWVDKSGAAIADGFAQGMAGGTSDVVSTAREMMQAIKDVFGTAEGLTLNFNMGPVTQQLGAATSSVSAFQTSLADTAKVSTGFADTLNTATAAPALNMEEAKAQQDALSARLLELEIQRKQLELAKGQAGANQDAIKAQLDQIKNEKLALGLQKDKLTQSMKYGELAGSNASDLQKQYDDIGKRAQNMPMDFLKATGQQWMNDIGMSGDGMIPSLIEQGTQYIFQVGDMAAALSAQQNLVNKQALGVIGR